MIIRVLIKAKFAVLTYNLDICNTKSKVISFLQFFGAFLMQVEVKTPLPTKIILFESQNMNSYSGPYQ
jgi:hypothetical protein